MPFVIPNIDTETESCVYKLSYGDRYIIAKGKTLAGSIFLFEKGYAYFLLGGGGTGNEVSGTGHKEGEGKNTFYFKIYKYIKEHPNLEFNLQVLLESNNGYQLLKTEQLELNKAIRDKKCLNSNIEAYIPQYRTKTKSYGWISNGYVHAFKKFLKNQ